MFPESPSSIVSDNLLIMQQRLTIKAEDRYSQEVTFNTAVADLRVFCAQTETRWLIRMHKTKPLLLHCWHLITEETGSTWNLPVEHVLQPVSQSMHSPVSGSCTCPGTQKSIRRSEWHRSGLSQFNSKDLQYLPVLQDTVWQTPFWSL